MQRPWHLLSPVVCLFGVSAVEVRAIGAAYPIDSAATTSYTERPVRTFSARAYIIMIICRLEQRITGWCLVFKE
jgi:hypothetical protein